MKFYLVDFNWHYDELSHWVKVMMGEYFYIQSYYCLQKYFLWFISLENIPVQVHDRGYFLNSAINKKIKCLWMYIVSARIQQVNIIYFYFYLYISTNCKICLHIFIIICLQNPAKATPYPRNLKFGKLWNTCSLNSTETLPIKILCSLEHIAKYTHTRANRVYMVGRKNLVFDFRWWLVRKSGP